MSTSSHSADTNLRLPPDEALVAIADYVIDYQITREAAFSTARYCLMDALGCAILALNYPECSALLGPMIPGTEVPHGVPIPGTDFILDPIQAAFNIGTLIRWLDYNDTWLAAEWGHPSDNLGAILAVSDYISRKRIAMQQPSLTIRDVFVSLIKAYEIQGRLALHNSFNRLGLDHVILVKIASAAVIIPLLGGSKTDVINVLSQVFVDGQSLRTYRHAPNTGSRKSWAAGDATSRAVRLAWLVLQGEKEYPTALSAKTWGFNDVILRGKSLQLALPYHSYVVENILFKIAFPAEFHAQTAVECAIHLHEKMKPYLNDLDNIAKIELTTHESAIRIISKIGPLHNPADRDHCLQYMVAIGLLFGDLTADHYQDSIAKDPRIDLLREKMSVQEDKQFSKDYLDPEKRSIANAIKIDFTDGSTTEKIQIEYPLGHRRRRNEGIPLLLKKFENNLLTRFSPEKTQQIVAICSDEKKLEQMEIPKWMELFNTGEKSGKK